MVDTTKTRTDLINRAATELGALPSNATLSDEDRATIDALVDPLLSELSISTLAINDSEAIPVEYFLPLARLLANEAAPSFGQAFSVDLKAANQRMLRRLGGTKPTREPVKAQYF